MHWAVTPLVVLTSNPLAMPMAPSRLRWFQRSSSSSRLPFLPASANHNGVVSNLLLLLLLVPAGSPSRGGDVAVYVFDIHQPSLLTPLKKKKKKSALVSISVFMAPSTVFYCINSPNNSPLSHSVLPVLFLTSWFIQLYISSWKSPSTLIESFVVHWA